MALAQQSKPAPQIPVDRPTVQITFSGLEIIDYPTEKQSLLVQIPDFSDLPANPSPDDREHRAFLRVRRDQLVDAKRPHFPFMGKCGNDPKPVLYTWIHLTKDVLSDKAIEPELEIVGLEDYSVKLKDLVLQDDINAHDWAATYETTAGVLAPICDPKEFFRWTFKKVPGGKPLKKTLAEGWALRKTLSPGSKEFKILSHDNDLAIFKVADGTLLEIFIGNAVPEDVECRGHGPTPKKDGHFARYYELLVSASHKSVPENGKKVSCPPYAFRSDIKTQHGSNCPPIRKK